MRLKRVGLLLLVVSLVLSLAVTPLANAATKSHIAVAKELDYKHFLEENGITVVPNGFMGPSHWDVKFQPRQDVLYMEAISNLPYIGQMINNAYYAESTWEILFENGKEGFMEGIDLIIGGKFFEGAKALDEINKIGEWLDFSATLSDLSLIYDEADLSKYADKDKMAIETIKALTFAFTMKHSYKDEFPTNGWDFVNLPFKYEGLISGLFNKDGSIKWTIRGEHRSGVDRYDDFLRVYNNDKVALYPIMGTWLPEVTEENIEKLLYDIYQILSKEEPRFFPGYSKQLMDLYMEQKEIYEEKIQIAKAVLEEIEQEIIAGTLVWKSKLNVAPNHNWTIEFSSEVDETTVDDNMVFVQYDGEKVEGTKISLSEDKKKIIIEAPDDQYELGETYTLHISSRIKSAAEPQKRLKQRIEMDFTIYNQKTYRYFFTLKDKSGNPVQGTIASFDEKRKDLIFSDEYEGHYFATLELDGKEIIQDIPLFGDTGFGWFGNRFDGYNIVKSLHGNNPDFLVINQFNTSRDNKSYFFVVEDNQLKRVRFVLEDGSTSNSLFTYLYSDNPLLQIGENEYVDIYDIVFYDKRIKTYWTFDDRINAFIFNRKEESVLSDWY